jgi:anaerobic selenocysteine-containing dehydrogenase
MSGLSHARLSTEGPRQWPCPAPEHPGTERLYTDRRFAHADGYARLIPVEHAEPVETPDGAYPLRLTTGRVRDRWHTLTRTAKSPALVARTPEPYLEISPRDAACAGLADGDFADIVSRRDVSVARCRVTPTIKDGTCFLPFHWGHESGPDKSANNLTLDARAPLSHQPELKAAAVRVRRAVAS